MPQLIKMREAAFIRGLMMMMMNERLLLFSYGQHSAWRRDGAGRSSHKTDLLTNESEVKTGWGDSECRLAGWTKTMAKSRISRISGKDDGTRQNLYARASKTELRSLILTKTGTEANIASVKAIHPGVQDVGSSILR